MTTYVSFSGGMDSTALLYRATGHDDEVVALSYDYGQRHVRELRAAAVIAADLGVDLRTINLRGLLLGSALLGAVDVPEGHYAEESMQATVVNGRNLLFASVAIAQAQPGDTLMLGVHAGDHPIYPDCRPDFIANLTATAATYEVTVVAPWLHLTKDQIVLAEPDAPYALSWSCYKGGAVHCGRCGTCVERAEAFHLAGVDDPTEYADTMFWREQVASRG